MKVTINNYVTSGVTVKNKPGQEKINLRIMLSRNITRLPAERGGVASFVGDFTLRLFKQGEEEMEDHSFEIAYTITAVFDCDDLNVADNKLANAASEEAYPYLKKGIDNIVKATQIGEINIPDFKTLGFKTE